jgi:hypothetical protein
MIRKICPNDDCESQVLVHVVLYVFIGIQQKGIAGVGNYGNAETKFRYFMAVIFIDGGNQDCIGHIT